MGLKGREKVWLVTAIEMNKDSECVEKVKVASEINYRKCRNRLLKTGGKKKIRLLSF